MALSEKSRPIKYPNAPIKRHFDLRPEQNRKLKLISSQQNKSDVAVVQDAIDAYAASMKVSGDTDSQVGTEALSPVASLFDIERVLRSVIKPEMLKGGEYGLGNQDFGHLKLDPVTDSAGNVVSEEEVLKRLKETIPGFGGTAAKDAPKATRGAVLDKRKADSLSVHLPDAERKSAAQLAATIGYEPEQLVADIARYALQDPEAIIEMLLGPGTRELQAKFQAQGRPDLAIAGEREMQKLKTTTKPAAPKVPPTRITAAKKKAA